MPTKLTDAAVRGLAPDTETRDSTVVGLAARRQRAGVSWVFVYQQGGKPKRLTLGRYPGLTLADAREKARTFRAALDRGQVPTAGDGPRTVDGLLDAYLAHVRERAKSPAQIEALLDRHIRPKLGTAKLTAMTRREMQAHIDAIRPLSVATAVGRYVTAAWNYGYSRDLVTTPLRLALPTTYVPRDRVLTDDEAKTLLADWLPRGRPRSGICAVMALCLLTGARRSEWAEATWDELHDDGTLRLPPERSKSGRSSVVVLSPAARVVLSAWPRTDDSVIFPTERPRKQPGQGGDRPGRSGRGFVSGFSRAVADSQQRTGIRGWTIHDLRRTCATGLARLGYPPHIIEAALNHTPPLLRRAYVVSHPVEAVRGALQAWAAQLGL